MYSASVKIPAYLFAVIKIFELEKFLGEFVTSSKLIRFFSLLYIDSV